LSRGQNISIKVRVRGFYWSERFTIYSSDNKTKITNQLKLKDINGKTLTLHIFSLDAAKGCKRFIFYCKSAIINETPYDLSYETFDGKDKKKKYPIAGQVPTDKSEKYNNKIALLDDIKNLIILRKERKEISGVVPVAGVGDILAELDAEDKNSILELGVNISISQCDKDNFLYTKIITITPRYIVVNKTNYNLEFKREFSKAVGH